MTLLLTILSVIGLIAIAWSIAKYNKSDNLFWILLIALFAGMAGGAIVNKLTKEDGDKKININPEQVYSPTQVSPANCADFYTELGDALASANPAVKDLEIPVRDSKIIVIAPSKTYGEIRGQPTNPNPLNKGTPGMPFDTS